MNITIRSANTQPAAPANRVESGVLRILIAVPVTLGGLAVGVMGLQQFAQGDWEDGIALFAVGMLLLGCGWLLFFAVSRQSKAVKRANAVLSAHPNEPWLCKDAWAGGAIRWSNHSGMIILILFALVWNSASIILLVFILPDELKKGHPLAWLFLLGPLIGAGLIALAVQQTLSWLKFGVSTFKMLHFPGSIGGQVAGAIQTSAKIQPQDGFHLKLLSIRRETTGAGKNQHSWDHTLWEDEKIIVHELLNDDPRRSGIPVFFKIPADAEPTNESNPRNKFIWNLAVQAKVPGVNYYANFEIPVFKLPKGAAVSAPEEDPTVRFQAAAGPYQVPPGSRFQMRELETGGREFRFPMLQNPAPTVITGLVFVFFLGAVGAMVYGGKVPFFVPVIFGLLDAGLLVILFNQVFKTTRIVVDESGLAVMTRRLLFHIRRQVPAASIAAINPAISMTSGQVLYYDLYVLTHANRDYVVASAIKDKIAAERLAAEFRRLLKLDKAAPPQAVGA